MKVLIDSSVWVEHFKQRNERLATLLESGMVLCHPYVVVEIACGTPPHRSEVIAMLAQLDTTPVASPQEVLMLITRWGLYGRGCGFVDLSLLASVLLGEQVLLWTLDKRLESAASQFNRLYRPALHS